MDDLVKVIGMLTGELAATNSLVKAMLEELPSDALDRVYAKAREGAEAEGVRLTKVVTRPD